MSHWTYNLHGFFQDQLLRTPLSFRGRESGGRRGGKSVMRGTSLHVQLDFFIVAHQGTVTSVNGAPTALNVIFSLVCVFLS